MEKVGRGNGHQKMRVDADRVEELVRVALEAFLEDARELTSALLQARGQWADVERLTSGNNSVPRVACMSRMDLRRLYEALFSRVVISDLELWLLIDCVEFRRFLSWDGSGQFNRLFRARESRADYLLRVPAQLVKARPRFGLPITAAENSDRRPSPKLVNLLKRATEARDKVYSRRDCSLAQLAGMSGMTPSYYSRLLRLNYLAPDIQTAILDGRQPTELTLQKLLYSALPLDWKLQRKILGFEDPELINYGGEVGVRLALERSQPGNSTETMQANTPPETCAEVRRPIGTSSASLCTD